MGFTLFTPLACLDGVLLFSDYPYFKAASLYYFHHDLLDSVAAATGEAGFLLERTAYEPLVGRFMSAAPSSRITPP